MATPLPDVEPEQQRPEFETVIHMLTHAAKEHPDRTAIICGDQQISYADYYACAAGMAAELIDLGAKGERVVIFKKNSIEISVAAYAVWAAGGQTVIFNTLYTESELDPLIGDADPTVILCDAEFYEKIKPLAEANNVPHLFVFDDDRFKLDQWRGDTSLKMPEPFPKRSDHSMLAYTGGTTGIPKAALHTHYTLVMCVKLMESMFNTEIAKDIWLSVAPQSHIWGWVVTLLTPVYGCNTIVLVPDFIPDHVVDEIERTKTTVFGGGPSVIYNALLGSPKLKTANLENLRLCLGGGSAFADATIDAWQEITGNTVYEAWGMSECAPLAGNHTNAQNKIGTIGYPCALTDIEVVDPKDGIDIMPVGVDGEFRIRAPQMISEYWKRPDETENLIRDGWLYTGDIGHYDEDGRLTIVDRKKDMVLVGGYNVYPREIDEILFAHPDILEAAAVGIPDTHRGEAVVASVVLTEGGSVTPESLIEHCKEKLAKYKVPTEIRIVESLPKTPAAKIDKMALRKLFTENQNV